MANAPKPGSPVPSVRVAEDMPRGQRMDLAADTLVFQQAAGNGEQSSVTFISLDDVKEFLGRIPSNRLGVRRDKNPAKQLALYLGTRSGPFLIRAPYKDPAQALRGARALLAKSRERHISCHCIVAVSAELFAKLQARAADPAAIPPPSDLQVLRDQCADLPIPHALMEAFLGTSQHADWVRRLIVLASRSLQPVLILGESGTGKEIVARQIHDCSPRIAGPFCPVNCAAIPENLFESELFGHVKGAFTNALFTKMGLWKAADNGTLFLDEVGDLSLAHQAKILRALEVGKFTAIGDTETTKSNARVIAATNRNLLAMIRAGSFREDLYYRLFAFRIRTPSLAEHPEDVPELAMHFWRDIVAHSHQKLELPAPVLKILKTMPWPGNARELRSFLNHLFLFANHKPITTTLLRAVITECREIAPGSKDK